MVIFSPGSCQLIMCCADKKTQTLSARPNGAPAKLSSRLLGKRRNSGMSRLRRFCKKRRGKRYISLPRRWRGRRDLNPRTVLPAYSLSRGAPSATWVLPRVENIVNDEIVSGGESGIRTHGPFGSPVFKTGSLNHSDISPNLETVQTQALS